jgi:hypothetical protein
MSREIRRMRRSGITLALLALFPVAAAAATLNGRITGPGGLGVHPIDIEVRDSNNHQLLVVAGDTTDVNGNYSMTVPGGKYDLTFKPTVASHLFTGTRTGINVSTTTTTNLALTAGHYVSGTVVGSNGVPVSGVAIGFHDAATGAVPAQVQDAITGVAGGFTTLVSPGIYDVSLVPALASRKVPREFPGVALAATDSVLGRRTLENGFLVTGTITDGSLFPLLNADFDVTAPNSSVKLFTPTDNTNAAGSASFVLPAGTYDFVANPPTGAAFATRTAQAVVLNADRTLPNLALPPGVAVTAHCVNSVGAAISGCDFDADSLPLLHRLHTPHDGSDAAGNINVLVSLTKFRMNIAPPVATKLLPVVFDSVQVTGARALGTVVHATGHWVSVHVVEQFTGIPIEGVNLDFVDPATGRTFLTIDDATDRTGSTRVVTDTRAFNLLVRSPVPGLADLHFNGFRTLQDTTMELVMGYNPTAGADGPRGATLALAEPWPNPTHGAITTAISTPAPSDVTLTVLDLAGRRVATLFAGRVLGRHTVAWDARDARGVQVPAGLYLLRLTDGRTVQTRRVSLAY